MTTDPTGADEQNEWAMREFAEEAGSAVLWVVSHYLPREGYGWSLDPLTIGEAVLNELCNQRIRVTNSDGVQWRAVVSERQRAAQDEYERTRRRSDAIEGDARVEEAPQP